MLEGIRQEGEECFRGRREAVLKQGSVRGARLPVSPLGVSHEPLKAVPMALLCGSTLC